MQWEKKITREEDTAISAAWLLSESILFYMLSDKILLDFIWQSYVVSLNICVILFLQHDKNCTHNLYDPYEKIGYWLFSDIQYVLSAPPLAEAPTTGNITGTGIVLSLRAEKYVF
jgi:hypothetical protein